MKKVTALLLIAVFAPCVFAGTQDRLASELEQVIEQKAEAWIVKNGEDRRVEQLKKELSDALASFKKFAYNRAYYDYNFMFQGMDQVRASYMELHKVSAQDARSMVQEVNKPIVIAKGNYKIRIADYVRMESCMIGSYSAKEEALWTAWSIVLEQDLKAVRATKIKKQTSVSMPRDFVNGINSFRSYVKNAKEKNVHWVLQSMMGAMDAFNANMKKNPKSAKAMAKEFSTPVKTGWGETLNPVTFIINHACELPDPVQSDLERFAQNVRTLSR